jgi:hypothetical protein
MPTKDHGDTEIMHALNNVREVNNRHLYILLNVIFIADESHELCFDCPTLNDP